MKYLWLLLPILDLYAKSWLVFEVVLANDALYWWELPTVGISGMAFVFVLYHSCRKAGIE